MTVASLDRRALLARLLALAAAPLLPAGAQARAHGRMLVRGTRGAGSLNRSGAIVWLGLVRGLPEERIASAISAESGEAPDEALRTVRRFARVLRERGLLDE